jgi:hypothetical protein
MVGHSEPGSLNVWLLIGVNLAGKIAAVIVGWTAPIAALMFWFLPDALLAYHVFVPGAQGLVRMHRRFTTAQREVWLTIDDGPDPEDTPRILELLAAHGARSPPPDTKWRTTPPRIPSRCFGALHRPR